MARPTKKVSESFLRNRDPQILLYLQVVKTHALHHINPPTSRPMQVSISSSLVAFRVQPGTSKSSITLRSEMPPGEGLQKVAWKVMTNAPKRYRVKPSSGVLQESETVKVDLIFVSSRETWFDAAGDLSALAKDKFLVKTIAIPLETLESEVADLWKTADPAQVQQQKVRCAHESLDLNAVELPSPSDSSAMPPPDQSAAGCSHHPQSRAHHVPSPKGPSRSAEHIHAPLFQREGRTRGPSYLVGPSDPEPPASSC